MSTKSTIKARAEKAKERAAKAKERTEAAKARALKIKKKQPKIIKEFSEFINQGNVVDLAVGVVVGSAFGKIVTALVDYIIMPIVGMIIGGVDFTDLYVTVPNWLGDGAGVKLQYGNFLQAVVDFLIVAFCIFLFVRFINKFKLETKKEEKKKGPSDNEKIIALLEDIKKNTK